MCASFDGTYLPGEDPVPIVEVERFLKQQGESGFFLVGAAGRVPVPPELAAVIGKAVEIFRYEQAVDMTALSPILTPEQAAPKLRAREDQVEEMLDAGTLPSVQTEHGRRIPLKDLLAYMDRRDRDWDEFMAEDWASDVGPPTEADRENMAQVRRELYEERKRRSGGQE